uniref:Uncharacterized protein n=2 Tax=Escherichia coli TaxID=562 RepID=A0A890DJ42_ECOLX|nr:hypothetical protein [Escherichia coli]
MSSNISQELLTAMIEQPVFSIAAQSSRVSDGPLPTQKTVLVALGGMFILSCKFSLQASIHFSDYRVHYSICFLFITRHDRCQRFIINLE